MAYRYLLPENREFDRLSIDLEREEGKNETQALDLSESEEEIELEDLHEYFITKESMVS